MDPQQRERYSRQVLFAEIGEQGQERLYSSSAVLVGCGALGTALANLLVRAVVGKLRIVDRDFVEPSNLQRQTLFEESDALEALPKAVAAFFFQAEDGIRDYKVTGVQTCALPI